jgi:rubrerythrin
MTEQREDPHPATTTPMMRLLQPTDHIREWLECEQCGYRVPPRGTSASPCPLCDDPTDVLTHERAARPVRATPPRHA